MCAAFDGKPGADASLTGVMQRVGIERFLQAIWPPTEEILSLSSPYREAPDEERRRQRDAQLFEAAQLVATLQSQFMEWLDLHGTDLLPRPEPIHVHGLMRFAAHVLQADAREAGVAIVTHPTSDLWVRADAGWLQRVVLNLVSNAVKYNVPGGRVDLQASATQARVQLRVSNTGPAMDDTQRRRLFSPFERLGKELSCADGTGMGLAVSHRLVVLMSGTLEMECSDQDGTRFCATLPRSDAPAARKKRA